MGKNIVVDIQKALRDNSDTKTRDSAQRFFKEKVKFYGVKSAVVVKIAKEYFKKIKNKKEIFDLCEKLFKSGYCEDALVAANLAYWSNKDYEPADFIVFEQWISEYIDNWAKCDTFCNHAVGSFIEKYPSYMKNLKKWTKSPNKWLRRASAVTLIIPARNGKFLKDIFEIANNLIKDREDMVQKGYGWMLKEASRKHQQEVFNYVMENKNNMTRTALRYAIEKMPPDLKKKAMDK